MASRPLVIVLAASLHICWGVLLLADAAVAGVTALSILGYLIPNYAAITLLASSCLAIASMITDKRTLRALLLVPQQFLLSVSAGGALVAMWLGQYADGVMHNRIFIAADQMHLPVLAVVHGVLILLIVSGDR